MYSSSAQNYRLSLEDETQELQLSCAALTLPHKPFSHHSPLLPLTNPQTPLTSTCRRRPPLSGQRLPVFSYRRRSRNRLNNRFTARSEAMPDLVDSYGRECGYSGSCVQVSNDLILYTGNDGRLVVSRLKDSPSPLFPRLPGPAVTISEPSLAASSRLLSLHPRVSSEGRLAVLGRYRQGVALFSVQQGEGREGSDWVRSLPPSLPVSAGVASVCWTNTRGVLTVSQTGEVAVWDQTRPGRISQHRLPGGSLKQGWAGCGPGYHPCSVLVADRQRCEVLDTRADSWTHLGLGSLGRSEEVRQVESEGRSPYCYLLTDHHIVLSDLRMPRAPVLSLLTGLARTTMGPSWLWGRLRQGSQDWAVAGDSWAQLRLAVLDWSHDHCHRANQPGELWVNCRGGEGPPRLLGRVESLGSWRDTVVRGRVQGEDWLHPALDQRAALPFTGLCLSADQGNLNVFAVNAIGDLFGKVLYLDDEEEEEEDVSDDNSEEVERWLEDWAQAVISKSFLPKVTLSHRFPAGQNKPEKIKGLKSVKTGCQAYRLRLPVFRQNKSWKKRFRGSEGGWWTKATKQPRTKKRRTFLPRVINAEWPENLTEVDISNSLKMLNIGAATDELKREKKDNSFRTNGFQLSKPEKGSAYSSKAREYKEGDSPLSVVIDAKVEKEEEVNNWVHLHHIPHFKQLNLDSFYNSSASKDDFSSRTLKVMMGEIEEMEEPTTSRRLSTGSSSAGAPSPAPPTEEDTSFPLTSFWEDLGVGTPAVSQSQSQEVDQPQFDEEEFEL